MKNIRKSMSVGNGVLFTQMLGNTVNSNPFNRNDP